MKGMKRRIDRIEAQPGADRTPWAMERVNGVLTSKDGQTMTDEEYLRRKREGLPLPMVWADEAL